MTSAAIPMAIPILMGAEQTGLPAAPSDRIPGEVDATVPSFAQRLSESVGEPEIVKGRSPEGNLEDLLPGLKDASIAMRVDGRTDGLSSVKGKIAGQKLIGPGQSESNDAARVTSRSATSLVAQVEIADVRASPKDLQYSQQQIEEPIERSSGSPIASQGSAERALFGANPKQSSVIEDRPAVSIGARPVVLNGAADETKVMEGDSAKETSKSQSSVSAPKTGQRPAGATPAEFSMMATPAATLVASAVPVVQLVDQPSTAAQKEFAQTAMGLDGTVSRRESGKVRFAAAYAPSGKEALNGTKAAVLNSEEFVAPAGATSGVQKPDAEGTNQSVMQSARDAASAPESAASKAHPLLEGSSVSPAVIGVETGALGYQGAVGHPATPSSLNASAHPADVVAASREQDGRGAATMSLEDAPRMLTATPTTLEVGIQNGTHGWLKVRAEISDGGGINASVVAPSFSAKEILNRELPSLSTYLEQEKIAVNSVVVHSPITTTVESSASNPSFENGAGGQTSQRGGQEGQQLETPGNVRADRAGDEIDRSEVSEDGLLLTAMYAGGGSWLSVRA